MDFEERLEKQSARIVGMSVIALVVYLMFMLSLCGLAIAGILKLMGLI